MFWCVVCSDNIVFFGIGQYNNHDNCCDNCFCDNSWNYFDYNICWNYFFDYHCGFCDNSENNMFVDCLFYDIVGFDSCTANVVVAIVPLTLCRQSSNKRDTLSEDATSQDDEVVACAVQAAGDDDG